MLSKCCKYVLNMVKKNTRSKHEIFVETCRDHEFQCANGDCIDVRDRCNGYAECSDDSDEEDCRVCGANLFR